jgi:hypothetical protein
MAFGAMVAASLVLRRQAWRAWILPVVYLAMSLALVAFGRLSLLGPVLGLDTRYVADSVPVFAVALGLAFMTPLDRRADPAWGRRRLAVSGPHEATDLSDRTRTTLLSRVQIGRWSPRQLAIGVVVVYAISAMITSSRIAGLADAYSSKQWLGVVRAELASHPAASVVDGNLPSTAIQAVLFPDVARLSVALAPIAPHIRWDAPSEHPLIFDASGHLRPAEVVPFTTGKPSQTPGCGYLVYRDPIVVPLEHDLSAWVWGVRFAYFTDTVAQGWVSTDGDRQDVQFLRGLHGLTLIHGGTAAAVTFWAGGNPVCVGWVQVGTVQPATNGSAPAT